MTRRDALKAALTTAVIPATCVAAKSRSAGLDHKDAIVHAISVNDSIALTRKLRAICVEHGANVACPLLARCNLHSGLGQRTEYLS
jgi:hypothetical protein